ncbi:hypothetical protein NUM3379_25270 [Kineococcus sp. NUM-3379]
MQRTAMMAYLVGTVVGEEETGPPGAQTPPGKARCFVDQGGRVVECDARDEPVLRALAGGMYLPELRAHLGDDTDEVVGWLVERGLVVLDPALDPGHLDRLRLVVELTDLGPDDARPATRRVRTPGGAELRIGATTLTVLREGHQGTLGAAVRALEDERGLAPDLVRTYLDLDMHRLLTRGGGQLLWAQDAA